MKQATIKIKKYAENVSVATTDAPGVLLRYIFVAFGTLAVFYALILGNIVFNIVARKTVETETRVLSSAVSDLELEYLTLSKSVDLEKSYSLGFQEVKPKFAVRKSLGSLGSLSLARNEL